MFLSAEDREKEVLYEGLTAGASPIKQGEIFSSLLNLGVSHSDVAKRISKTLTHVTQCVDYYRMLSPHKVVMEMISENIISASTAKEVFDKYNAETANNIILSAQKISYKLGTTRVMPKHIKLAVEVSENERLREPTLMDAKRERLNVLNAVRKAENVLSEAKNKLDKLDSMIADMEQISKLRLALGDTPKQTENDSLVWSKADIGPTSTDLLLQEIVALLKKHDGGPCRASDIALELGKADTEEGRNATHQALMVGLDKFILGRAPDRRLGFWLIGE